MSTPQILPSDRRNGPAGLSTTLNDGWRKYGGSGVATYVSATSFSVADDRTADFTKGRVVRIYHATSAAYKYVVVVSSAYTTLTTVTVTGDTLLNETYSSIWIDLSPVAATNLLYRLQAMLDTPGALAQGDLLYVNSTSQLKKLTIGSADKVLVTDGTTPSWSKIVNANIDAAAAIATSKLALNSDINQTWSPDLTSTGSNWNFSSRVGWYTKIGDHVWYNLFLYDTVTTGAAATAKISTPVAGKTGEDQSTGTAAWYDSSAGTTKLITIGITTGDVSNFRMYYNGSSLNGSDFAANDQVYIQGMFRTA